MPKVLLAQLSPDDLLSDLLPSPVLHPFLHCSYRPCRRCVGRGRHKDNVPWRGIFEQWSKGGIVVVNLKQRHSKNNPGTTLPKPKHIWEFGKSATSAFAKGQVLDEKCKEGRGFPYPRVYFRAININLFFQFNDIWVITVLFFCCSVHWQTSRGQVSRWIPHFPSVPLVLGGLPLHTLLTELPILFSGCFSTKGNYTHSCRRPKTLKELRSAIPSGGKLLPQELLGKATWPNLLPFSHR